MQGPLLLSNKLRQKRRPDQREAESTMHVSLFFTGEMGYYSNLVFAFAIDQIKEKPLNL